MKIGIVAPHIFMQDKLLSKVIFSPGELAINLSDELSTQADITLFTPGKVTTKAHNITADITLFEEELRLRGDDYLDLLKKHPLTFISLARSVQSELLAKAFTMANNNELDVVHVYMNEEEIALPFSKLCKKPVVFTHHDPFNFSAKYRSIFPKYKDLNWISMSFAQRKALPKDTNWVGNIYHGLKPDDFKPVNNPTNDYIAFLGRIIEPKGLHIAIAAVQKYNLQNETKLKIKIAGKHYNGAKDSYWQKLLPFIDGDFIEYVGFISDQKEKNEFLGNAKALIIPSTFEEPFGMVMIEALACGTPLIGLDSGAIPEVIKDAQTGLIVKKIEDEFEMIFNIAGELHNISKIKRRHCRQDFEDRFTLQRMTIEHLEIYRNL